MIIEPFSFAAFQVVDNLYLSEDQLEPGPLTGAFGLFIITFASAPP